MKIQSILKLLILGIMGSAIFYPLVQDVDAAPSDVRGSGNAAVASYTTTEGSYILWTNGRITNAETGGDVAPPYENAPGFAPAQTMPRQPRGSENVAVDYLQNESGTYTLFADGSVKKATDDGASAPRGGSGKVLFAAQLPNSGGLLEAGLQVPRSRNRPTRPNKFVYDEEFEDGSLIILPIRPPSHLGTGNREVQIKTFIGGKDSAAPVEASGDISITQSTGAWTGEWAIVVGQ